MNEEEPQRLKKELGKTSPYDFDGDLQDVIDNLTTKLAHYKDMGYDRVELDFTYEFNSDYDVEEPIINVVGHRYETLEEVEKRCARAKRRREKAKERKKQRENQRRTNRDSPEGCGVRGSSSERSK